ncbi:putative aminomutase [Buchnera aphidicola str. Bp (Baizongia pistaciae)]|uniref:L-lysine 2,3-aminomutase n=1 Tax=Buchnera aphidicola subsp. Baizongia pistaciae (strain Bp) TaxID=224915 RepID=EPMB_BUCBP|nr:EF-P beta-lysylation protein EpmB [Buchnera aphidicola]Q89B32.1 RecName: Full=L-lysine 2,3-aminomutase; Short=LAM; AltName: Full=EF-P post-translational modification enzyme B [Buchnera aphidicola str. Bp (Baizongia pistaciae)]AAO26765.1 putative aminomutase [Buchnera aphidicola str. Bp (Baizongia pistaciae)]
MLNKKIKKNHKEDWITELTNAITNPDELLRTLNLKSNTKYFKNIQVQKLFSLRVPKTFVSRMKKNDPFDPLLLQILPHTKELKNNHNFVQDPLEETKNVIIPGLIRKYNNRILLLLKTNCAINCRYCFRRYFPYSQHPGNKENLNLAIQYIKNQTDLNEVILSGGDPLMAKDHEIQWIVNTLSNIYHIKRLRIHTRLPIVIPSRITNNLCKILSTTRLKILIVTHINHAQEINHELQYNINKLHKLGITLLNQSVLLRGINDNAKILSQLSNKLFDINILPYYLHILDKVKSTTHFYVSEKQASIIVVELLSMISGFLVPKLVCEHPGKNSKIYINLNMK